MSTTLSGWGAQRRVPCTLQRPDARREVHGAIDPAGTIARGLGRSYGDAAVNEEGRVVGMRSVDHYLAFDQGTGLLTCEAGVSLEQILNTFAPRGWFPGITPGTKYVTVGGCIANDVHGKGHHAQGSFVSCVTSMRILVADGTVVQASREENSDLFWACFGGLGLLGIVLDATLQMRPVETTYFHQQVLLAEDLNEMIAHMEATDDDFPYSVANIDFVATGAQMGKGVLTVGDHATREELPRKLSDTPRKLHGGPLADVPIQLPGITLNPLTRRTINGVIGALLRNKGSYEHYDSFFYPLDILTNWNRGYGPRGFIQYQFVLPVEAGVKPLSQLMSTIMSSDQLPFLNVLKRLGPGNEAPLSFPLDGYTFAIDFPVRDGLQRLTARLDEMVIDAGGRVYLGKDAYLSADAMRRMYPRIDEWLEVKARWDPHGVFTSNMGRRVGLVA